MMRAKAVRHDAKELLRDVLIKIFLMLSWSDLHRCGRVCEGWKGILSSKAFTTLNLDRQKEHLLVKTGDPLEGKTATFTLICKESLKEEEEYELLPNPHMSQSMLDYNMILGCCNGIICLYCHRDERIVLWNPVTNEVRVPTLPENLSTGCTFDFGFDPESNDYKIVAVKEVELGPGPGYEFYVYNLSRGCWMRSLSDGGGGRVVKRYMKIKERGSTCTGNVFSWWIMEGKQDRSRILSFHMGNEKLILTSLPNTLKSGELVRYDTSLAVIHHDRNVDEHSIWILGELGVEGSWTCKLKIGTLLPKEATALWSFNTNAPVITAFLKDDSGVFLGREPESRITSSRYLFQANNISEVILIDEATKERKSVHKFKGRKSVFQLCTIKKSLVPLINDAEP